MSDSLIRTKLQPPFTRPGVVVRPRLQARIAEGLRGPLTLITAPAGFGKTTLVASALASGMPVSWLSLDKNDSQPGRFLSYLIAALNGTNARVGMHAAHMNASITPALPEIVLTSLINDLDDAGEMALVLDDYQLINSQAVHDQVAFLIEHCPKSFHLVISTRSDPPLPLARLRARGQTVELRAADLRFSEEEAARFLSDVMGLKLDAHAVTMLAERTEGWIAGLQMAALSMRDRQDVQAFIETFSGTHRFILDYLLEEVLACLPQHIQHFLLHTSILERLSAPLCDALLAVDGAVEDPTGEPLPGSSAEILQYLERENIFLIPLDDARTWFRYHHLFSDLLKARLQHIHPDLVVELHTAASEWFELGGYIGEAVQHLFAANREEWAADLIEQYASRRWGQGDHSIVVLADQLPVEMILERPIIGLCQAWLLIMQGQVPKAVQLLTGLAGRLAGSPREDEHWMLNFVSLALAFLMPSDSLPGAQALPDLSLLETFPAGEWILRDGAEILYCMAAARRGMLDLAVEVSERVAERKRKDQSLRFTPTLVAFLARAYFMQGRLHAAADLCREFLGPGVDASDLFISIAGSMNIVHGDVLYEWNCLEQAEHQIRRGLIANEPWKNIMTEGFGCMALVRVLTARGDFDGALRVIERFERRMEISARPREFNGFARASRARLLLARGDLPGASAWADEVERSEDYSHSPYLHVFTLARIRQAQGRCDEMARLLKSEVYQEDWLNRTAARIEYHLLWAACHAGRQYLAEALEHLRAALALAEPDGYVRIFVDGGEQVRDLLSAYLRSGDPAYREHAQWVLRAFSPPPTSGASTPPSAALVEPLSAREIEVLGLMAQGCTNQEIARQLIVAPGTIKAHAASIYRKLDAANRTEAVALARRLGILS